MNGLHQRKTSARGVRVALGAAGLVWSGLLLSGCASNEATTALPGPVSPEAELRARRGDFRRTFLLTGELEAVHGHPVIVPKMTTWQVNVRWVLDDGSQVESGDKVLELDTTQIVGDLAQKQIAADTARSELYQSQSEAAVQLADKEFAVAQARTTAEKARIKAAVPEELVDRRTYQEARLAAERTAVLLRNAQADLEAAREASRRQLQILRIDLETAERDIERAEQALEAMVLRAPRSGIFVVGEHPWEGRKIQVGDQVWVGMTVGEIPDLSEMRVRAKLIDVDDGEIAVGMPAVCTIDAYPEQSVNGAVDEIGIVAQEERGNSTRRYFDVVVDLDRADPEIMRPGMSVKIEVETALRSGALLVPRASLALDGEGTRAILADGSMVPVEPGECNATECIVRNGLEEGARLGRRG